MRLCDSLYVGQLLRTTTNEYAKITTITPQKIYVAFRGKIYCRDINIIGEKLFILPEDKNKISKRESDQQEFDQQESDPDCRDRTCRDCKWYVSEECFGQKRICNDFKEAAILSKQEIKNWPQYGDATYFRLHGRKK